MIKALHFIWSASFGGIEKVVMDLCRSQQQQGDVAPTLLIGTNKGAFRDLIADSGINHVYAGFRSGSDFRPALYRKLKALMNDSDIIHLHTFNPLVFAAAISSGKPLIYTIHGNFNFGRKMRLTDRINQSLRRYFFNRHTNLITFNSDFTRDTAFKRYGLQNVHTLVIHNGIPLKAKQHLRGAIELEHSEKIQGKFVVGTSSRFAGFKRIDRLIEAFSVFAAGKDDVLLMLVGDGVLRKNLEEQVRSLGLEEKTLFTGFREQVGAYQNAMNVCVFPSCGEPFGLVAVETLSLGKPTLAFRDAGGMLEILTPEFADDIAENTDQLAARLGHYYRNRNSEDPQSELRIQVASRYDIEPMRAAMESAYKSLIVK